MSVAPPTADIGTTSTYRVRHRTAYSYDTAVSDAYSVACLLPRATPTQRVMSSQLTSSPEADELDERTDAFGNRIVQMGVHRPHTEFDIVSDSTVEVTVTALPASALSVGDTVVATRDLRGPEVLAVGPYRAVTRATSVETAAAAFHDLLDVTLPWERPVIDALGALCSAIYEQFAFDSTATDLSTPLDDVMSNRRGVCQDFAHLAVAAARRCGLAARYVSGYIETQPPPGQPKLIGSDASHAWCSVWVPDVGWVDLDPTNDQLPPHRHVTVGWGRDYRDIAPMRGVVIGPTTTQKMTVAVDVLSV